MLTIFAIVVPFLFHFVQCRWTCEPSWTENNQLCYLESSSCLRDIGSARSWCEGTNAASLASFTTGTELSYLHSFSTTCSTYWLDVSNSNGQWVTRSGTTLANSFISGYWASNQPGSGTRLAFGRGSTWPNILLTSGVWLRGTICTKPAVWVPPTVSPSTTPSRIPTKNPTRSPSASPTTPSPTTQPSISPSRTPTKNPTKDPSQTPTNNPSNVPSANPTKTTHPSPGPSMNPSSGPTQMPTTNPSRSPTRLPSTMPVTSAPVTSGPSTSSPATLTPTRSPSPQRVISVTQVSAGQQSGGSSSGPQIPSNSLYIFFVLIGAVVLCICGVSVCGGCFVHRRKKALDQLKKELATTKRQRLMSASQTSSTVRVHSVEMESPVARRKNKGDDFLDDSSDEEVIRVQQEPGSVPPPVPPVTHLR